MSPTLAWRHESSVETEHDVDYDPRRHDDADHPEVGHPARVDLGDLEVQPQRDDDREDRAEEIDDEQVSRPGPLRNRLQDGNRPVPNRAPNAAAESAHARTSADREHLELRANSQYTHSLRDETLARRRFGRRVCTSGPSSSRPARMAGSGFIEPSREGSSLNPRSQVGSLHEPPRYDTGAR